MKFKERRKTVVFRVFQNYNVSIIVSTDKSRSYRNLQKRITGLPKESDFEAIHVYHDMNSYLIFSEKARIGTIAHECWHVTRRICDWIGAELDNELIAYHIGYLTQTVYDFINKK
jgi:hypothetical protein